MTDINGLVTSISALLIASNASLAQYTSDHLGLSTAIQDLVAAVSPPAPASVTVPGPNLIQSPTKYAGRGWASVAATTLANQGVSLDGTNNLSQIIDNATNGRHIFYQGQLNPKTAGTYTFSVYLKAGTLRYAQLSLADVGNFYGVVFDTETGAATDTKTKGSPTGTSSSIVATPVSGLYLATISMDFSGGSQNLYPVIATSNSATPVYDGNGQPAYVGSGQYVYAWSASLTTPVGDFQSVPPWVMAGYTQNTFHVGEFNTSNVDMAMTRNPGFKFYLHSAFSYPDTLPSHVALNADGSVTLTGNIGTGNVGSSISTIASNRGGDVTQWRGTAFGGGGYFEATLSFDPNAINSVNGANGFPAWWADPVEHSCEQTIQSENWPGQAPGFVHFTELDFFEYNVWSEDARLYTYNGTVIDWSGAWNGSRYPVMLQNTANRRIQLPPGTDFTQPHRYGFLWVPAVKDGADGYFQWFFDRLPTSDRVTYKYYDPVNPPSPPATASSPWLYGVADSQHYHLFLNSDTNSSLRIYSVDVWQASSAGNIVK